MLNIYVPIILKIMFNILFLSSHAFLIHSMGNSNYLKHIL